MTQPDDKPREEITAAETAGRAAAEAFIDSFNAQDHERHARTLNYPHTRLANGAFVTIESAEDFATLSAKNEPYLAREGWHHTSVHSIDVVHAGVDKVHLALQIDRCHEDGTVYNSFATLWIATCLEDHWGIQFRSSYLLTPRR